MGSGAIAGIVVAVIVLLTILTGLRTVNQGTVAVTTIFGKYRRTLRPGLNVVVPFIEKIFRRISVQNRAVELQFQAITFDQANVYFTAMMVYGAISESEDTVKNIAFKFVSEKDFLTALVRSVEGSTRGFVATKRQAEILVLRAEAVEHLEELANARRGEFIHAELFTHMLVTDEVFGELGLACLFTGLWWHGRFRRHDGIRGLRHADRQSQGADEARECKTSDGDA